ncbi:Two pore potassium channel [Seminavis robusta]|uniref:Two pore potassium channel n=1 Tax=Seminavis robusta TaxID=568900 RepID=A0A9N8EGY4_9STRA|nr:Two pore potassium channel [Seminavis robusta]|eukprot:Sro1176_g249280.1 Two pore potassium channel (425) ;mRNA; f:28961-30547
MGSIREAAVILSLYLLLSSHPVTGFSPQGYPVFRSPRRSFRPSNQRPILLWSGLDSKNEGEESSNPSVSGWQPDRILSSVLKSLWKGVTIPFPQLRNTLKPHSSGSKIKFGVSLRIRDCLVFLLSYLTVGVLAFSFVFERWSIVDALYFTSVCFSTVGYGDLCPETAAGRIFTGFFGMAGIAFLGAAVATICSTIVHLDVESTKKYMETEGKRRILNLFQNNSENVKEKTTTGENQRDNKLHPMIVKVSSWLGAVRGSLPSLSIIFLGGAIMRFLDGGWHSIVETMYYSIITASTIGLGDFCPRTPRARLFAIFYIPLSVGAAGELLSSIATALVKRRQKKAYETDLQSNLTLAHLRAMDADDSGCVDREEYVYFMLKEMGLISQNDLDELFQQFEALDVSNSGRLDKEDLKLMAKLKGAEVLD